MVGPGAVRLACQEKPSQEAPESAPIVCSLDARPSPRNFYSRYCRRVRARLMHTSIRYTVVNLETLIAPAGGTFTMATLYDSLNENLQAFIRQQHLFFISTAPRADDGLINCSPKGLDTLRILDDRTLAYLDLTGSGAETIAHLRDNGRFVLMFCSFSNRPNILRLHGTGEAIESTDERFARLVSLFPPMRGTRAVILLNVKRVADSCGWGVPEYEFRGARDTYPKFAASLSDDQFQAAQVKTNLTSLDGLPALTAPTTWRVSAEEEAASGGQAQFHVNVEHHKPQAAMVVIRTVEPQDLTLLVKEVLPRLVDHINNKGGEVAGRPFLRYLSMGEGGMEVAAGIPVTAALPPTEDIESLTLPGGKLATALYHGEPAGVGKAWSALNAWATEAGYSNAFGGWDVYENDHSDVAAASEPVTRLYLPLESVWTPEDDSSACDPEKTNRELCDVGTNDQPG